MNKQLFQAEQTIIKLKRELKVCTSFLDDWQAFFPDKGPREIKAELEMLENENEEKLFDLLAKPPLDKD